MRLASNHGVPADAAELMDSDGARQERTVLNDHVAGQQDVVGQDHLAADLAVVTDVDANHDQVAVSHARAVVLPKAQVERSVLSDLISIADLQSANVPAGSQVLRPTTQDGPGPNHVFLSQARAGLDHSMPLDPAVIADQHVVLDDRKRSYLHASTQPGGGAHDGCRMNTHVASPGMSAGCDWNLPARWQPSRRTTGRTAANGVLGRRLMFRVAPAETFHPLLSAKRVPSLNPKLVTDRTADSTPAPAYFHGTCYTLCGSPLPSSPAAINFRPKELPMANTAEMYNEAERLKDEGKLQEAIDLLDQVLAEEPGHVLSHLALAVLYGRVGNHHKAIEHGEQACQLEPEDPFNFTAMSVTYQRAWAGTQQQEYIARAEEAMARAHMLQGRA
jgi:hypothetical protein